jgi:hypothetical protein
MASDAPIWVFDPPETGILTVFFTRSPRQTKS